jgi:hypothetical protein
MIDSVGLDLWGHTDCQAALKEDRFARPSASSAWTPLSEDGCCLLPTPSAIRPRGGEKEESEWSMPILHIQKQN